MRPFSCAKCSKSFKCPTCFAPRAIWGYVADGCSKNVVEYLSLCQSTYHAISCRIRHVCFQIDSMLVARQVNMEWSCRSVDLQPLLEQ